MKLLVVTPYFSPIYGGPYQSIVELAKAQHKYGLELDIVTTNANGFNNLDVPLNIWVKEKYYRVQYFPRWNFSNYTISLSLSKWLFHNVANYDLLHINTIFSYPVLPAYLACQRYKIPYLKTPHGMLEPWALSYKAWKKRFYYTLLEKPALDAASAIHALNSLEAQNIKSLGLKAPIVVIPNGINCEEFEYLPDAEIFYQQFPTTRDRTLILFLGRLDPKKGLDLLAPAFAKVRDRFPQAHLVVAGPDNTGFLPTVQSYFAQAGCLEAVTLTGMLTGSLKLASLAAANLYVAPSYSEGFSISVLEGMASGLPCVITKGCNFPEAADAQAANIVGIDSNAIADALIKCFAQPQEAKEMGDRARRLIFENYTWDRAAYKMVELYRSIINNHSIPY